jgi:hypothetical protein
MSGKLVRRLLLGSAALGAIFIGAKFASMGAKPQTKLASSVLAVPIEVVTEPFDFRHFWTGRIRGSVPSSERAAYFLALVVHEFSVYPADFFRGTKLVSIVLCTDLTLDSQPRGAIPDFVHNILYLDVDSGSIDQFYQRRGMHHELFHIVDLRDDGKLYKDNEWLAINADSFHYGNGGVSLQSDSTSGNLLDKEAGFLSNYSMSGVEEDKAELFSFLIVSPKFVEKRAERDRMLASKVERMKSLLVSFCPQLNDSFWQKLKAADRGTDSKPYTEFIPVDNPQ